MVKHRLLKEPKLLILVLGFNLQKYTPFLKGTVYRAVRHRSNIRLTCICGFADAQSGGKVGAKVA